MVRPKKIMIFILLGLSGLVFGSWAEALNQARHD